MEDMNNAGRCARLRASLVVACKINLRWLLVKILCAVK